MRIDIRPGHIFSFCTAAKRDLDLMLESSTVRGDVEVVRRSFRLDPEAPKESTGRALVHLTRIKGMGQAQGVARNDGVAARTAEGGVRSVPLCVFDGRLAGK